MVCPIKSELPLLKRELLRLRVFWRIRMKVDIQDHGLRFFLLKDVEGNRGGAKESCECVAAKVLQVAAVGIEQLINKRECFFDDLISLRG